MRAQALACAAALLGLAACDGRAPAPGPASAAAASAAAAAAAVSASDAAIEPGGHADRLPPPEVPPIVRDGVSYAQAEDGRKAGQSQPNGVLVASDAASGKQLWSLAVYPAEIDPKQEADAQWVFFKSMAFDADGRLRIVNEAGKVFLVDVRRRTAASAP